MRITNHSIQVNVAVGLLIFEAIANQKLKAQQKVQHNNHWNKFMSKSNILHLVTFKALTRQQAFLSSISTQGNSSATFKLERTNR